MILFLDDGRLELDTNTVERAIRPLTIGRKNFLFAGNDGGGRSWAIVASLIQTAKLNDIEPFAYLKDVLERLVAGHPITRLDELLPWRLQGGLGTTVTLSERKAQVDYRAALANGLPIGSGEIESAHRYVAQQRLKRPGAWWRIEHAEHMLALRIVRINGDWDAY